MPDAFLIGAGLSYGLTAGKLPLTAELYTLLAKDEACKPILARYKTTKIDTALSYLDLEIATADAAGRAPLEKDRTAIEAAINAACADDAATEESKGFCSQLPKGARIFTFNYDLLLEKSLWALNRWSPKGGYGGFDSGFLLEHARDNTDGITFFKLHGSLNFHLYEVLGATDLFVDVEITETDFVGLGGSASSANDRKKVGFGIYPSYLKSYTVPSVRANWRAAFKAIADCDRLFSIGYSFPPEDPLSCFLVDEYLLPDPRTKTIYILDLNADVAAARLATTTSVLIKTVPVKCDLRDIDSTKKVLDSWGVTP